MALARLWWLLSVAGALQLSAMAQTPRVPEDPLELVSGTAQPVQTAPERADAINLITRARQLTNIRAQPYDLKTTFTSTAPGAPSGVWNLEDMSPSGGVYRWTAQGPSYSVTNLFSGHMLYSSDPSGRMPLRLAQVRAAIFFHFPMIGARASIRTAPASLNGADVTCVLVEHMARIRPAAGGRLWGETEYCVDPKSGLLMTWSPAPGVYVDYDYSTGAKFHGISIPGKFTISEAGQMVIEARTEGITDPKGLDPSLFDPARLTETGVGSLMSQPWQIRSIVPNFPAGAQAVVVHGLVTPSGELTEAEVVASSDAALNQAALEHAARIRNWTPADGDQPGATPQSHEVFITVQFMPPA